MSSLTRFWSGGALFDTLTVSGNLTFDPERSITLVSNANDGHIGRLIELKATFDTDRPWIHWSDENGLSRVGMGYHTRLTPALGGNLLAQYEIKTIADQAGPNPQDMRTRFTVGTGSQRVKVGVVCSDVFEIYQGENPITVGEGAVSSFGVYFRTDPQDTFTSSNFVIGNVLCQVDATDNAFMFIDVNAPYSSGGTLFPGNKGVQLVFFRNTNISSASNPKISVKKGDGTNTDSVVLTAKSGQLQLLLATATAGALQLGNDSVANLYRSAAGVIKSDGKVTALLGLGCGNSAAATTPGAVVKKMEVFDTAGASLGFVPIYSTIT